MATYATLTRAELLDRIETQLQDSSNAVWGATEISDFVNTYLPVFSLKSPYIVKETLVAAASKDQDVSSITDLLYIKYVEYEVDEDPKRYRNFQRLEDEIILDLSFTPTVSDDIYLYCAKSHHLDGDWVAATAYTVGQFIAPTTKNGCRYECTTAGTSGATEPTWGTVAAGVTADGAALKWTCRTEEATSLNQGRHIREQVFIDMVASQMALTKPPKYINKVNIGKRTVSDLMSYADQRLNLANASLRRITDRRSTRSYPKTESYT